MRIGLQYMERHLAIDVRKDGDQYTIVDDGKEKALHATFLDDSTLLIEVDGRRLRVDVHRQGDSFFVALGGQSYTFLRERASAHGQQVESVASPEIVAPMPGKVIRVFIHPGDRVSVGDTLFILEAMKMESRLRAEAPGVVERVNVGDGDLVEGGEILAVIHYGDGEAQT